MKKYSEINSELDFIQEYFSRFLETLCYLNVDNETDEFILEQTEKVIEQIKDEIIQPSVELFSDLIVLFEEGDQDVN